MMRAVMDHVAALTDPCSAARQHDAQDQANLAAFNAIIGMRAVCPVRLRHWGWLVFDRCRMRGMANDGDQIALTSRLDPRSAEVLVMEGDAVFPYRRRCETG
jgi:hypothetical protein